MKTVSQDAHQAANNSREPVDDFERADEIIRATVKVDVKNIP